MGLSRSPDRLIVVMVNLFLFLDLCPKCHLSELKMMFGLLLMFRFAFFCVKVCPAHVHLRRTITFTLMPVKMGQNNKKHTDGNHRC